MTRGHRPFGSPDRSAELVKQQAKGQGSGEMLACQGCGLEAYREFDGSPVCMACAHQVFVCICTGAPCYGKGGMPNMPGSDDHSECAPMVGRCTGDGGTIPRGKGYEGLLSRRQSTINERTGKGSIQSGEVVRQVTSYSGSVNGGLNIPGKGLPQRKPWGIESSRPKAE